MRLKTRTLAHPTRPQFSLRALLGFTTAVCVLLGAAQWLDWLAITNALLWTTGWLQIAVVLWPVVIALLWLFDAGAKAYGNCVLAMGTLVVLHVLATIVHLDTVARSPILLDQDTCIEILGTTLTWTIPSLAVGLVIGLYMGLTARTTLPYLTGLLLAAGGLFGFVMLGLGLEWLPLHPSEFVWWR